MPSLKHTHSYVRYGKKRSSPYKCNDPKCTHYAPKALILGKETLCPECRQTVFILTVEDLKRVVPKCKNCSNTQDARLYRQAKSILEDMVAPTDQGDVNDQGEL